MINTCATVDPDHRSARRKWSISETGVGCCYDDDDGNDNDDDDDDDDGGVMVLVRTEDRGLKSLQLVAKKLVVGGWLKLATPRKRSFREEIGEAFGGTYGHSYSPPIIFVFLYICVHVQLLATNRIN